MDANHQNGINNNLATTENKIWLPPSFTNNKILVAPALKKKEIKWGFADRTVFDWTILVSQVLGAIAIPFVVTMLGLYLTQQITQQQNQLSERQHQTDIQIAQDQQQEAALQNYIDHISGLLLNNKLRQSNVGDEVQNVARAETLTTLPRLSADRKRSLLQFLYESGLINVKNVIVKLNSANCIVIDLNRFTLRNADLTEVNMSGGDLSKADFDGSKFAGANLSGANLTQTYLTSANLFGINLTKAHLNLAFLHNADLFQANLQQANLSYAILDHTNLYQAILDNANLLGVDLRNADLRGANLQGANLFLADLSGADLRDAKVTAEQLKQTLSLKGAIMPDGSIHP